MAYETATPFLPHYPPPPRRVRMSRWWPVSFLILALVLLIIGGALIGASAYNAEYFDDNYGEFYGGVVLLVLGGICKLIGWVLLAIWCVQGRRLQQPPPTYVSQPWEYAAPQPGYANVPMYSSAPLPPYQNLQTATNGPATTKPY